MFLTISRKSAITFQSDYPPKLKRVKSSTNITETRCFHSTPIYIYIYEVEVSWRLGLIKILQYVFGFARVKLGDIATVSRGGSLQEKRLCETGFALHSLRADIHTLRNLCGQDLDRCSAGDF